jgi:hypothetical protein
MTHKKHKLRFHNAPDKNEKKPHGEKKQKQDLRKLLGSAVVLSACSKKKKDVLFDDSHPKIVDNEDGTQTIVGLEESMVKPFANDGIEVDAWDVACVVALLLILRFSKLKPAKGDKSPE